jgi:PAS domain-containing protein
MGTLRADFPSLRISRREEGAAMSVRERDDPDDLSTPEDDLRQPGLFDSLDDHRRHQLRERGWHETGGIIHGRWLWRTPDGSAILDEDEAFARLAREATGQGRVEG